MDYGFLHKALRLRDVMNEQKTAILMDSGGDLPADLCEREGIKFLPLHVIYPEKDYQDGIDIDPRMVYERFPDEIPTTSTPSIQEILDIFEELVKEGYEKLIAVTISCRLSGTGNTVAMAAKQFKGLEVFVFDTRNISFGSGIFALWAARKLREGVSYSELIEMLVEKRRDSFQLFYMDTLKYLEHGGRIGHVASFIGEALHLKPIISCDPEGVYYTVAKIRGRMFGKRRMLEEFVKRVKDSHCWLVIGEGCAHEEAEEMKEMILEKLPNAEFLFQKQINATLAINTGPGLVGVMTFIDP